MGAFIALWKLTKSLAELNLKRRFTVSIFMFLNPASMKEFSRVTVSASLKGPELPAPGGGKPIFCAAVLKASMRTGTLSGTDQTAAERIPSGTKEARIFCKVDVRFGKNISPHLDITALNEELG